MCGIAGIFSPNLKQDEKELRTRKMLQSIHHRGPESSATFTEKEVCLGHNRLKIIDLSEEANQPFHYQDLVLVFNGEIYNYLEVKQVLLQKGYQFQTASDTEVICAAYQEYGEECVQHFMGMWAFALWDKIKQKLFCSRDRFGIKPFYYFEQNGSLFFASEYKALKQLSEFDKTLNYDQISRSLVLNWVTFKEETYYEKLKSLPPSHHLIIEKGEIKVKKYWQIDLLKKQSNLSFEEKKTEFAQLFEQSIKQHARADVPTGSCLSGGLDSSAIVSTFGTLFPTQELKSFTIFYDQKGEVDERPFVQKVVDKYPTVKPFYFSPLDKEIADSFHNIAYHADIPVLGSSFISQYFLMQLAKKEGITVAIDGQGSDEYLGGYLHSFYRLFAMQLKGLHGFDFMKTFKHHLQNENYGMSQAVSILAKTGAAVFQNENDLYNLEFSRKSKYFLKQNRFELDKIEGSKMDTFLYHLLFDTTLQALLHFEDRNSMAFSIESRVPFLDHRLVEFVFSLNTEDKISTQAETKYLLRESLRKVLPTAIYERKDKKGFVTPGEVKWLEGPLRFLLDIDYKNIDFLNIPIIQKEIEAYKKGDKSNAKMVWKFACLNYWMKEFN